MPVTRAFALADANYIKSGLGSAKGRELRLKLIETYLPLEALAAGVLDSEVTAVSTLLPALAKAMPGLTLAGLFGVGMVIILWPRNVIRQMDSFRPTVGRAVACGVLAVWSVLSFSGVTTFIYSNF